MQYQSTAPLPRPARRGPSLVTLLVVLGAISAVVGATTLAVTSSKPAPQVVVVPTAAPRWAPTVGSAGQVSPTVVFVEHLGLLAYRRAENDRDSKGMSRAMDIFDYLWLKQPTRVVVVERRGDAAHVDILDGEYAGRRGWLPASWLTP